MKNLLSENGEWISRSEFVDSKGNISIADGKTIVDCSNDDTIRTNSWVTSNGETISNNYIIKKKSENHLTYRSSNKILGIQSGTFDINKNHIFSKFAISGTTFNGFEVITREGNICRAYGALYDQKELINTWTAVMEKVEN
jgi:hypothetical protein